VEKPWVVTADEDLFIVVRAWARGDLCDSPEPDDGGLEQQTLLITTPAPWRTIVAIAQRRNGLLRPMLVLKNAVALWALRRPLEDGPVSVDSWPALRRLFMIHNPGLDGLLHLLDHAFDAEGEKPLGPPGT
jgi:hypothetical protein